MGRFLACARRLHPQEWETGQSLGTGGAEGHVKFKRRESAKRRRSVNDALAEEIVGGGEEKKDSAVT